MGLKEYVGGVMALALLVSICRLLSPEGKIKKYVGFVGSLCVVSLMMFPIWNAIGIEELFPDIEYGDGELSTDALWEYYGEAQRSVCERDTEERLKAIIASELDAELESFEVDITLSEDENSFSVTDARVIIRAEGIAIDPYAVKETISSMLGVECEIIYGD